MSHIWLISRKTISSAQGQLDAKQRKGNKNYIEELYGRLILRSFVVHRRLKSALERQLLKKEHQLVFLRCVGEGLQANNPHCSKQHRLSLQSFTNKQRNIETGPWWKHIKKIEDSTIKYSQLHFLTDTPITKIWREHTIFAETTLNGLRQHWIGHCGGRERPERSYS